MYYLANQLCCFHTSFLQKPILVVKDRDAKWHPHHLGQILSYRSGTVIKTTNFSTRLSNRSLLIAQWDRFPVGTDQYHLLSSCWHSFQQLQNWTSSFKSDCWFWKKSKAPPQSASSTAPSIFPEGFRTEAHFWKSFFFFLNVNPNGLMVRSKDHKHWQHSI